MFAGITVWGATRVGQKTEDVYHPVARPQPICGLVATANLCLLKGVEVDLATVQRHLRPQNGGVSVQDCADALAALGVPCTAIQFNHATELPENVPVLCVVRCEGTMHALVAVRQDRRVLLIDGAETHEVSAAYLDRVSGRIALIPR